MQMVQMIDFLLKYILWYEFLNDSDAQSDSEKKIVTKKLVKKNHSYLNYALRRMIRDEIITMLISSIWERQVVKTCFFVFFSLTIFQAISPTFIFYNGMFK